MSDPSPKTTPPEAKTLIDSLPALTDESRTAIHTLITDEFDGADPDVIFAFSGGIGQERDGTYRSLAYSTLSEHGIPTGGRTRVIAMAAIADSVPEVPIITTSFNRFEPDEPTHASVLRKELVDRGVDEDRIIEETNSFSTITQLTEMVKLSLEKGWTKISLMTNEYHEPRMRAMLDGLETLAVDSPEIVEQVRQFREANPSVVFITAESILRQVHPLLEGYLGRVAASPQFQKTLATEKKGLADLLDGKYKVVLEPENPRE